MNSVAHSRSTDKLQSQPARPRLRVVAPYDLKPMSFNDASVNAWLGVAARKLLRLALDFEAVPAECMHMLRRSMCDALDVGLPALKRDLTKLVDANLICPVWWDFWRPPEGPRRTHEQSLLELRKVPKRRLRPASFDRFGRLVASPELIALAEGRLAVKARHGGARRGAGRPRKSVEPTQAKVEPVTDLTLAYTPVGDAPAVSADRSRAEITRVTGAGTRKKKAPKNPSAIQVEPANDISLISESQNLLGLAEGQTSNLRGCAGQEFLKDPDQPTQGTRQTNHGDPDQEIRVTPSHHPAANTTENSSHTIRRATPANDTRPQRGATKSWFEIRLADLFEPGPEPEFPF